MKKVVCFGLCFLIVLCSFVISFASDNAPVILPIGDNVTKSGYGVLTQEGYQYFNSTVSPTYLFIYQNPSASRPTLVFFSDLSNASVNRFSTDDTINTYRLSNVHDGFYYSYSPYSAVIDSSYIFYPDEDLSVTELIDFVNDSVFRTSFDLTYIVDGSVSWLSTMAQAVKSSGLLLFMVLIGFCGLGIGLFRRFTNG